MHCKSCERCSRRLHGQLYHRRNPIESFKKSPKWSTKGPKGAKSAIDPCKYSETRGRVHRKYQNPEIVCEKYLISVIEVAFLRAVHSFSPILLSLPLTTLTQAQFIATLLQFLTYFKTAAFCLMTDYSFWGLISLPYHLQPHTLRRVLTFFVLFIRRDIISFFYLLLNAQNMTV